MGGRGYYSRNFSYWTNLYSRWIKFNELKETGRIHDSPVFLSKHVPRGTTTCVQLRLLMTVWRVYVRVRERMCVCVCVCRLTYLTVYVCKCMWLISYLCVWVCRRIDQWMCVSLWFISCVCEYVNVLISMYVCVCVCVCVVYIVCVCKWTYWSVCVWGGLYRLCVWVSRRIDLCVCVCVCVYVQDCIYRYALWTRVNLTRTRLCWKRAKKTGVFTSTTKTVATVPAVSSELFRNGRKMGVE